LLNIEQNIKLVSTNKTLLSLDFAADMHFGQTGLETFEVSETEWKKYNIVLLIPELNNVTYGSYVGRIKGNVSSMLPAYYLHKRQLNFLQAVIGYNKALYALKVAKGETL
jgi:hypothetical protein